MLVYELEVFAYNMLIFSCEEAPKGVIWQVDPMGGHASEQLTMGSHGGKWESFTYDISDLGAPHFFVTEDHVRDAMSKFIGYLRRADAYVSMP